MNKILIQYSKTRIHKSNSVIPAKAGISKNKDSNIQDSIINKFSFTYDNNSNILSNGQDNYIYDEINRLTNTTYKPTENNKGVMESFVYDSVGNRITSNISEVKEGEKNKKEYKTKTDISNYTSNILNQYTSISSPSVIPAEAGISKNKKGTLFIYDNNGNLIQDNKQIYSYDYRNRLVKVTNKHGEIKSEFSYDVLGRRISKETEDSIVKYIYSNNDIIQEDLYEKDDGKVKLEETKENIYGKGVDDVIASIVKKDKKSKIYFFHKNQLGSIVAITDEKGNIVEEYRYDTFGKAYIRNGKSDNWREFKESKINNTRLFTGREYDKEIGLYYYRARYYSAELGRFISRDPIGQVDDVNLYSYVGNNSVKYVDPMGREKILVISFFSEYDLGGTTGFWEDLALTRSPQSQIIKEFVDNKATFNNIIAKYKNYNVSELIIAGHGNAGAMKFGTDRADISSIKDDYSGVLQINSLKYLTLAACSTGENGGETSIEDIYGNSVSYYVPNNSSYAKELSIFLERSGKDINVLAPDGLFYPNLDRVGLFGEGNIISFPSGNSVYHFDGIMDIPQVY